MQNPPVMVLWGHMHRPFTIPWGLVSAATSMAFQFALSLDDRDEPPVMDEPFHYSIRRLGVDGAHAIHRRFPGF